MNKWHNRFMDLADQIATWSKDESTKVGCVIVDSRRRIVSTGYNGFPVGIDDNVPERHERPLKYSYFEHAERNAFYNAANNGVALKGCTLYIGWIPCTDCARGIIQSGIERVVIKDTKYGWERWGDHFKITIGMLREAGVKIITLDGTIIDKLIDTH